MDIPGELIVPMPNCDHKSICRFSSETSSSHKTVWGVIQEWADAAKSVILSELCNIPVYRREKNLDSASLGVEYPAATTRVA
jgi:hypothetical protein